MKEKVGKYLNTHCVAAVQKVATFNIVAGNQKQGGNVAAYFCTPDRQVLHAIAGQVGEEKFLKEVRWAVETWNLAQLEDLQTVPKLKLFFRKAHGDRLASEHRLRHWPACGPESLGTLLNRHPELSAQGKVHLLLSTTPLAAIEMIYRPVFERILNEKVSTDPVKVAER